MNKNQESKLLSIKGSSSPNAVIGDLSRLMMYKAEVLSNNTSGRHSNNMVMLSRVCSASQPLNKAEVLDYKSWGRQNFTKAFTLIELLVVVLIIGILSAIALPQYEKTVERARVAEARIVLKAMYENMKLCELEFGQNADECDTNGEGNDGTPMTGFFSRLTIELPGPVEFTNDNCIDNACVKTKHWEYGSDSRWGFYANRVINGDQENYPYYLSIDNDGTVDCTNLESHTTKDYCKMICGGNGCILN